MKFFERNSRRRFLKNFIVLGTTPLLPKPLLDAATNTFTTARHMEKNFTFLFQGDSITDGNRTRNNDWNHVMGHGY